MLFDIPRELIVYLRSDSDVWQCRLKVDNKWMARTTKERDVNKAVERAKRLRLVISELLATKTISICSVINYENGQPIEGLLCRYSGYIPPAALGRKCSPKNRSF